MIRKLLCLTAIFVFSVEASAISSGRYAIVNMYSAKALEVEASSADNGANVVQWAYWGGANQLWDVTDLGNGYHSIRAAHTGKSLDAWGWDSTPGAEVRQYDYWGGDTQQWGINSTGNYFVISNKYTGLSLDIWGWDWDNGGDVRQWSSTGLDNQKWSFVKLEGRGSACNSTGSSSITSTVYVDGYTFDGGCRTYNPSSALGTGDQDESQDPAFRVQNGGVLTNAILGNNGVDGVHVYNGGNVHNFTWSNVGEDALTIKSSGNVFVRNFEGYDGSDKFFQVNAASNLYASECIVNNMGKFLRQNGGTTFQVNVEVNNCAISNMSEGIFRTDSSSSTAVITNSTLNNSGSTCIGSWASCSASNNN